jgi:hypothetical protein
MPYTHGDSAKHIKEPNKKNKAERTALRATLMANLLDKKELEWIQKKKKAHYQ